MPQYDDILLYVARQKKRGVLSWPDADPAQPAATSFTYQSKSSNKPLTIAAKDVSSYTWCSTFDGNTLKLLIPDRGTYKQGERPKGATLVRLCGLPHAALAEVEKFVEGLNRNASEDDEKITLQRQQLSTRGLNSGKVEITGEFSHSARHVSQSASCLKRLTQSQTAPVQTFELRVHALARVCISSASCITNRALRHCCTQMQTAFAPTVDQHVHAFARVCFELSSRHLSLALASPALHQPHIASHSRCRQRLFQLLDKVFTHLQEFSSTLKSQFLTHRR